MQRRAAGAAELAVQLFGGPHLAALFGTAALHVAAHVQQFACQAGLLHVQQ